MVVAMQKLKQKPWITCSHSHTWHTKGHMATLDPYLLHNRHFKKETRVRCLLLWLVQYN